MGLNLGTSIGKIKLKNPILVASGTFGHAKEFETFYDLRKLGAIVTKTVTLKPRLGNPPPRIVETPSGMLNAIGLQNPGVEAFIAEKVPYLRKVGVPVIVSVMGYSVEEFTAVVRALEPAPGIDGYELNLSCPNVSYGHRTPLTGEGLAPEATSNPSPVKGVREPHVTAPKMFAHDAAMIEEVVGAIRQMTGRTLIAKLGPDVSDIGQMARAAERGGADAVALINTFIAMAIDVKTRRPVLANRTGGLSGPCIRPIAVRMTWEAARAVKIPVVGIGGIRTASDALEFLIAGACAVQVGTANFTNPAACMDILEGIGDFMKKEKIQSLSELIGSIRL